MWAPGNQPDLMYRIQSGNEFPKQHTHTHTEGAEQIITVISQRAGVCPQRESGLLRMPVLNSSEDDVCVCVCFRRPAGGNLKEH